MFEELVSILKNDGIILYPTDSIWGLGCDATSPIAIEKIYKIKQRDSSKSLIILVENLDRLEQLVEVPPIAKQLMAETQKPLTIVYNQIKKIPQNLLAKDGSIAIRVVKHPFCEALITAIDAPLISTSANFNGEKSPKKKIDISRDLIDLVDAMATEVDETQVTHQASKIVKIIDDKTIEILRP